MGKQVTFLSCTDGRYGLETAPKGTTPEQLTEIRKAEAIASAKLLGVTDVRFLDLSDGGLYEFSDLWRGVARVIGETQPELIFAPDPDVPSECHADHRNVGEAARRAGYFAPYHALTAQYGADRTPFCASGMQTAVSRSFCGRMPAANGIFFF